MRDEKDTAHQLAAYSDAVFAVIVTIMVLELKAPEDAAFSALWPLWPTALSLAIFTSTILVALVEPRLAFGLICVALLLHLSPEVPGRLLGVRDR